MSFGAATSNPIPPPKQSPPDYGVKTAIKALALEIEEAGRLAQMAEESVGAPTPPGNDNPAAQLQPTSLAYVIDDLTRQLAEANQRQRLVITHLSS